MNRFIEGLKKLIVVVSLVLSMLLLIPGYCLARQDKVDQSKIDQREIQKARISILLKHYKAISDQRKKLSDLYLGVVDIGKNVNSRSDNEDIVIMLFVVQEACLTLDTPYRLISLYGIMLSHCDSDVEAKEIIKDALGQKTNYEKCLDNVNIVLGRTTRPAIALQCDKFKTEIRNTIDILDQAKKFFE